jgi:hypothetical protein
MFLSHISYSEFDGTDQQWILEGLPLSQSNLIVGRNATGKSRSLNIVGLLAKVLRAELTPTMISANFSATFISGENRIEYSFRAENEKVVGECFSIDGKTKMSRGEGGVGTIWYEQIEGGKDIAFQVAQDELAAVSRRDTIQHPYLQPLHEWALGVRHYHFGTPLGKDNLAIFVPGVFVPDYNNPLQMVALYRYAIKTFENEFREAMLRDMDRAGFNVIEIEVGAPVTFRVPVALPGELTCFRVKEKNHKAIVDQSSISQGMFRVISILTLANLLIMENKVGCLLIDDIGEGLDFERSCLLVDLLRDKAKESHFQLIVSTNDRFVMNKVPLEEWAVIQRIGSLVRVRNNENSHEIFEEFKFTGLSNFSFLEMDFLNSVEELAAHE